MNRRHPSRPGARLARVLAVVALGATAACTGTDATPGAPASDPRPPAATAETGETREPEPTDAATPPRARPSSVVDLAFAGDIHFELHLADLLRRPRGALGPITETLRAADLTMVNLETSITDRGTALHFGHPFRTGPEALDVLHAAGVDVVTMANNHGVDYGPVGLRDTLRAVRNSPVPVVGIGRNRREAFRPHRVSVRGTDISFFGASSEPDQLVRSAAWPDRAGIAAAFAPRPPVLIDAVRRASGRGDLVVVYMHWGTELVVCPTPKQLETASALAEAGADVVVGSHSHVLQGSGWLGDTYVNYGLGNFLWYHNAQAETGVLQLRVRDGEVVRDSWVPALMGPLGRPNPLSGEARTDAIADWRALRGCTDLAPAPPS